MLQTGGLNTKVPSQVYHKSKQLKQLEQDQKFFEHFLLSMSVRKDHLSYHDAMPNICYVDSGLYELAWPAKGWEFFYTGYVHAYNMLYKAHMKYEQLDTLDVYVNGILVGKGEWADA